MSKPLVVFHENENCMKFKISRQMKEIIESFFWVIEKLPEDISLSSSSDHFTISNFDKNKRIEFKVED